MARLTCRTRPFPGRWDSRQTIYGAGSLYGPEITVEPIKNLLYDEILMCNMSRFEHGMTFVLFGCPQETEHRILGLIDGKRTIVAAVDHQDGYSDLCSEIQGIDLREDSVKTEAST